MKKTYDFARCRKIICSALLAVVLLALMATSVACVDNDLITGDRVSDSRVGTQKDLVIPLKKLSETTAQFFDIVVDDIYVEVLAFKVGDSYRTAFNTCQVCHGSREAYFKQWNEYLECQNCHVRFAFERIGIELDDVSCSPYPILDGDRQITNDSIIISYKYLSEFCSMHF